MKKVRILASILLTGAICLSGCEEAPTQTVDSGAEGKTVNSSEEEKTVVIESEKYVSLAEAKEQVNQLKGNSVNGFTFSKNFEMPEVDSISSVQLKQYYVEDVASVEQSLFNIWDTPEGVNWNEAEEEVVTHPDYENYIGYTKEDKTTGCWFSCDRFGFFCGYALSDSEATMLKCIKEYDFWSDVNLEDVKNDKYKLNDGEITIGDAVAYVENKLNNYLAVVENNLFQYKVKKISVVYDETAEICDLNMTVGRVYNGIDIPIVSDFNPRYGIAYENIHCGAYMFVTMSNVNKIDYFNNCVDSFAADSVETKDTIISPMWAVKLMNESIANVGGTSYNYCGLIYLFTQTNTEYENNKQALFHRIRHGADLKPYWIFAKKNTTENNLTQAVLIDAIDGSLYYYDIASVY